MITGVYGAGKSTVAAEISHLLEQRRAAVCLLDLDFLGWGVNSFDGSAAGNSFMLRNLAAVVSNYREGGISVFVLAYFVSSYAALRGIREAVGVPLRVVRLSVPLPDIEQRLAADVTTERREELREAARQIEDGEGVGVEDVVLANDRPVLVVAEQYDLAGLDVTHARGHRSSAGIQEDLRPMRYYLARAQVGTAVAEQAGQQVPGWARRDHGRARGSRSGRHGQDGRFDLGAESPG